MRRSSNTVLATAGELLCRNVPTYGSLAANATGRNGRFDEKGYLAVSAALLLTVLMIDPCP